MLQIKLPQKIILERNGQHFPLLRGQSIENKFTAQISWQQMDSISPFFEAIAPRTQNIRGKTDSISPFDEAKKECKSHCSENILGKNGQHFPLLWGQIMQIKLLRKYPGKNGQHFPLLSGKQIMQIKLLRKYPGQHFPLLWGQKNTQIKLLRKYPGKKRTAFPPSLRPKKIANQIDPSVLEKQTAFPQTMQVKLLRQYPGKKRTAFPCSLRPKMMQIQLLRKYSGKKRTAFPPSLSQNNANQIAPKKTGKKKTDSQNNASQIDRNISWQKTDNISLFFEAENNANQIAPKISWEKTDSISPSLRPE